MWKKIFILLILFLAACRGQTAVSPTPDSIIAANDATAVTEIGQGSYQAPYKLLWNPDLDAVLVGHDTRVSLMNADGSDGGIFMTVPNEEGSIIDFSLDGTLAALLPDEKIVHLYLLTSEIEAGALTNIGQANNVHVSPDGSKIALTSADDPLVSFWNVETETEEYTLNGFESEVLTSAGQTISEYRVAFSSDWGTMIWMVNDTVQLQAVGSGEMGLSFQQDDLVQAIALSSDNVLAVATAGTLQGGDIPIVKLWDAELGTDLGDFELPIEALSLAFSPDGGLLATGNQDGTIMLWDVANQEEIATLTGHSNMVQHLAFSPDGRLLASAGADTVHIWGVR